MMLKFTFVFLLESLLFIVYVFYFLGFVLPFIHLVIIELLKWITENLNNLIMKTRFNIMSNQKKKADKSQISNLFDLTAASSQGKFCKPFKADNFLSKKLCMFNVK